MPPEVFSLDPWAILNNPNLLLKINGKYYNWEKAAPILVSMMAYKVFAEEIPLETKEALSPLTEPTKKKTRLFIKSLILSSDKLKSLGLKQGINNVIYEVNSRLQGIQQIYSKIYLWN